MSVIIKDFKMPINCEECQLCSGHGYLCFLTKNSELYFPVEKWGENKHPECPLIDVNNIPMIDVLNNIISYNGLSDFVRQWKEIEPDDFSKHLLLPINYYKINSFEEAMCMGQIQFIWMICVLLFGDYGTSPRTGWIEKKEDFYNFIDLITELDREKREYD